MLMVNGRTNTGERVWGGVFVACLIAGLLMRLSIAASTQTPGHGDTAFYYTVAENLVKGRGLVVDYVVYFLNGLEPITHYSGDFWNPLPSVLLSLPMFIFGPTVFNALMASMFFGLVPPMVAYVAGRHFFRTPMPAALAGALTCFAPIEIRTSVATDSIIFFGAFGSTALLLTILAFRRPYFLLIAAICTGLAQFTRQDGLLLLITLELSLLFTSLDRRRKVLFGVGALAIHLLVLSPLMVRNYGEMHAIFPPGPARTMFLTRYEDFHEYGAVLDFASYRAELGIRGIVLSKLAIARDNLDAIKSFLTPVVALLVVVGLAKMLVFSRETTELAMLVPPGIFAIAAFLFYTIIASFSGPGSLPKSLAVLAPFVCIIIVDLLAGLAKPAAIATILVLGLMIYTGEAGYRQAYTYSTYYNETYREYDNIRLILAKDAAARNINEAEILVMTRNPWDVYAATGYRALMIPNNNLRTIYFIASYYGANYLLLPAPRAALQGIYTGSEVDPRLQLLATVVDRTSPGSDFKLFRIQPDAAAR